MCRCMSCISSENIRSFKTFNTLGVWVKTSLKTWKFWLFLILLYNDAIKTHHWLSLIPIFRYCLPAGFLRQSLHTLLPSLYIVIATLLYGVGTSITLLCLDEKQNWWSPWEWASRKDSNDLSFYGILVSLDAAFWLWRSMKIWLPLCTLY